MMCSMKEVMMHKSSNASKTDCKNRKFARKKAPLSFWSDEDCDIVAHSCCTDDTKLRFLSQFVGMTCFKIAHSSEAQNMLIAINRNCQSYQRNKLSHPICKEVKKSYDGAASPAQGRQQQQQKRKQMELHRIFHLLTLVMNQRMILLLLVYE